VNQLFFLAAGYDFSRSGHRSHHSSQPVDQRDDPTVNMAGKTDHRKDAEKKRKRADTQDKERQPKRHRQQDDQLPGKQASELKDNALKVLADLKTGALEGKLLNGKHDAVADAPASRWELSSPVGGRIADIDPVFSVDEKYVLNSNA